MPKILLVNPNTSEAVTTWLAAEARRAIGAKGTIVALNATSGVAAIQTPEELQRAEAAVLATIDAHLDVDAIIIAAFGDPALRAARDAEATKGLARPVAGLAESGLLAAGQDGRRFAIVTMGAAMAHDIATRVASLGLTPQLATTLFLPVAIPDLIADRAPKRAMFAEAVRQCAKDFGAEAILLGGAPLAGLGAEIAEESGLTVLDGVAASVAHCLRRII